jgi:hypothetical protein
MTWDSPGRGVARGSRPSRLSRFVDEAKEHGWSVEGNLLHGSVSLIHEDDTQLQSTWHRDSLCTGWITTRVGTKEKVTGDEVRAAVKGARCTCSDPIDVFGYPHVTPSDECAFKHEAVRGDLETIAGWERYARAWDAYVERCRAVRDAAEALQERRSA